MKTLITGGAGYIGSHTIIELIENGYNEIVSADNYINSDSTTYTRVKEITGISIQYFDVDLSSRSATKKLFDQIDVDVVIHFAALKSVPESVEKPIIYYRNNLNCLLNILECMKEKSINQFIFSSSCSIYGNPKSLPVTELSPFGRAESSYAQSKQIGEHIIADFCNRNPDFKALSLRYFNPVGAHNSGLIGELQHERPNNLLPIITQVAAKLRKELIIFGKDYPSNDGTCIRDYIHVSDIANAHVKGIQYLHQMNEGNYKAINLGSGTGTTVLEMVNAFERTTGIKVPYRFGKRREGDVFAIYANNEHAKSQLNWHVKYEMEDIMRSAWNWQENLTSS